MIRSGKRFLAAAARRSREKYLFGATFVVNKLTADFSQKPLDGLKR
jgi:hypothetical protein